MNEGKYINVPSMGAITRNEAIRKLVKLWGELDWYNTCQSGLCYQADHGETVYLKWDELTEREKHRIFKNYSDMPGYSSPWE